MAKQVTRGYFSENKKEIFLLNRSAIISSANGHGHAKSALLALVMAFGPFGFSNVYANSFDDPFGVDTHLPAPPGRQTALTADFHAIPAPMSVQNQQINTRHEYTLAELTALALSNNPQTHSAWASLRAQAASVGISEAAWLPKLTLNATAQQAQSTTSTGYSIPTQRIFAPNLSLSWLLYDFGQREAGIAAAKAGLVAARFANDQTLQTVLANVATAYYQALADRVLIEVDKQSVKTAQNALDAAQARYRSGQATISDLYQAKAALAQAQGTLATAEQTRLQNEGALASAVGLPVDTRLRLAPLQTRIDPKLEANVKSLLQRAIAQNPNLQNAQAQVAQARATLDQTERAGLPSISLGANQGLRFQQSMGRTETNSIGITLSVPLFTGFNQHYQTAQARAKLAEAEANRDTTYQSTELAVWQGYYAFRGAVVAIPSARAQVENASEALKAVQAQYKVGYATIQELLTAQSTLATAEVTLAQNALNAYTALAKLGAAIGQLGTPMFSEHTLLDPTTAAVGDSAAPSEYLPDLTPTSHPNVHKEQSQP
jgi:TolC family type I secretion outer membrane protein